MPAALLIAEELFNPVLRFEDDVKSPPLGSRANTNVFSNEGAATRPLLEVLFAEGPARLEPWALEDQQKREG